MNPALRNGLRRYAEDQSVWSQQQFGPGRRTVGLTAHIVKECQEVREDPDDAREWIDIIILAIEGFLRHGGKASDLGEMLEDKQRTNFERAWPAAGPETEPVEHLK